MMMIRNTVCLIPYKGWIPLVGNGPNTGVFTFNIVPLTFWRIDGVNDNDDDDDDDDDFNTPVKSTSVSDAFDDIFVGFDLTATAVDILLCNADAFCSSLICPKESAGDKWTSLILYCSCGSTVFVAILLL